MDYTHINYKDACQDKGKIVAGGKEYKPIGLEIATGNFICISKREHYVERNILEIKM